MVGGRLGRAPAIFRGGRESVRAPERVCVATGDRDGRRLGVTATMSLSPGGLALAE